MIQSIKEHKLEIGLVLALSGIQISVIIKSIISIPFNLTNVIFVISLLLITDYNALFEGHLFVPNRAMTMTFGYNIYVAIYGLVIGASISASGIGLIYTFYTIIFIFLLMTNEKALDGEYLVSFTWALMGILSVILFYLVTDGFTNFGATIMYLSSGADRLSLSAVAFFYLCAMPLYKPKNVSLRIFQVLFTVIALYDVMACSRRGLMVALILIYLYHFWQSATFSINPKAILRSIGVIVLVVLVARVFMNIILGFSDMIASYIERLTVGVNTYFGNTESGVDAAAVNRANNINSFSSLFQQGSIIQQLVGRGFGYFWMDVPYLEAFIDLGIFGGIWYLVVQLFIPVRILLRRTDDVALRFAQYFSIIAITYNIYSGVPYGNVKFVPTVLLIYAAYSIRTNITPDTEIQEFMTQDVR